MPSGLGLYHSPWDVVDFQADAVAKFYLRRRRMPIWDTGLGKSHFAMAASAMLAEDDLVVTTIIVAEQTKLGEWVADFQEFTDLDVRLYHGPAARRRKLLVGDLPQVLVTTYETLRNDASIIKRVGKQQKKKTTPGPLTARLMEVMKETGKGICVHYDEISKIRNRTNDTYKAHAFFVKRLGQVHGRGGLWVSGLTATPIEGAPDNAYNEWRIIDFQGAPDVAEFERGHICYRDYRGKAVWMNLGVGDEIRQEGAPTLAERMAYLVDRKRKSDPDVKDRFPKTTEDFSPVLMTPAQQDLYRQIERLIEIQESERRSYVEEAAIFTVQRQLVGHPEALLYSEAETSAFLVQLLGADNLKAAGSGKLDRLVEYLRPILAQGDQAVVYSFFGRSIVPLISQRLSDEKMSHITHTGALSGPQKEKARMAFRAGEHRILLSSDAGSKGINLPEASYIINYELPLLHSTYVQRTSRNSRMGPEATDRIVTAKSFIVPHTVEASIAGVVYQRNQWHDLVVDSFGNIDPSHVKAADRIALRQISRVANDDPYPVLTQPRTT